MGVIGKYRLKKDLPDLCKGVIFEHRDYDVNHPDWGNIGNGVLILGWINGNGNCQGDYKNMWCGETYIFPGQLAANREWFEPISMMKGEKNEILSEIENLKNSIKSLETKLEKL